MIQAAESVELSLVGSITDFVVGSCGWWGLEVCGQEKPPADQGLFKEEILGFVLAAAATGRGEAGSTEQQD